MLYELILRQRYYFLFEFWVNLLIHALGDAYLCLKEHLKKTEGALQHNFSMAVFQSLISNLKNCLFVYCCPYILWEFGYIFWQIPYKNAND